MGIMALYASFGIAYNLAKSYKLDPLSGGSLGLAAFLLTNVPLNIDPNGWMLSLSSLGGSGMFTAIIMSIFAVEIFRVCKEKI